VDTRCPTFVLVKPQLRRRCACALGCLALAMMAACAGSAESSEPSDVMAQSVPTIPPPDPYYPAWALDDGGGPYQHMTWCMGLIVLDMSCTFRKRHCDADADFVHAVSEHFEERDKRDPPGFRGGGEGPPEEDTFTVTWQLGLRPRAGVAVGDQIPYRLLASFNASVGEKVDFEQTCQRSIKALPDLMWRLKALAVPFQRYCEPIRMP
jgi:hypothetical protein